jgi:hypothetical protein
MTTTMTRLSAGDVIEVPTLPSAERRDETMTCLVLLSTDEFVVLDPCDGTTPFVLHTDELHGYRRFDAV